MLASVVAQVSFVALVGVTVLALGTPDTWVRGAALLHATNWVLVALLQDHGHPPFQQVNFTIDVIGSVCAVLLATTSGQTWMAIMAAFQSLGVVTRLIPLLDPTIRHRATETALYMWEAGSLIALSVGVLLAIRRRAGARSATQFAGTGRTDVSAQR